jgi:threonine synthase
MESRATALRCIGCGASQPVAYLLACPVCSGLLEVEYDLHDLDKGAFDGADPASGLWRYAPLLPVADPKLRLSLGEGLSPLLPCPRLGADLGFKRAYVKLETGNPTDSVKDRGAAVVTATARQLGFSALQVTGGGNVTASVAAYTARAGIRTVAFLQAHSPAGKLAHTFACTPDMVLYRGDRQEMMGLHQGIAAKLGLFDCIAGPNPYFSEGPKTLAFEIYEQLGRRVPGYVVVPAGTGDTLLSVRRGFLQLKRAGWTDTMPEFVTVQAANCGPIVRALDYGEKVPRQDFQFSIAEAVAVPDPGPRGKQLLDLLRQDSGIALSIDDNEAGEAQLALSRSEGIWAGPSAALPIAALRRLARDRSIDADATVVALVTESGQKSCYGRIEKRPLPLDPEEMEREVKTLLAG